MRKTFLLLLMAFVMSWSSLKAEQGHDYIIMLDNGSSIIDQEYANMKRGAIKFMEQILACNPGNRVAVVQYGTGKYGEISSMNKPVIYIESDFTKNHVVAQNFTRRLDFGDHLHESLGIVGDALDGNLNADIISNQKTLTRLQNQDLRVVVFTDAERNTGGIDGSHLVNSNAPNYGSIPAFLNVLNFKNVRFARLSMVHVNTNLSAIKAAAVIANHGGGTYSGPVELIQGDSNSGVTPRSYYNRPNGFEVGVTEMNYWKDMAEAICDHNSTLGAVDFLYEPHECIYAPSDISGHYYLPSSDETLLDLKLDLVNLQTGDVYPIAVNPIMGSGNFFTYQFQFSDFEGLLKAGSTGLHKFRVTMTYTYGTDIKVAYSWNNYPLFDYDINMDCPIPLMAKSSVEEKLFKLTPNPTNGLFKVILNKEIKSGALEVRDLIGNVVYNKVLRGDKEIEVDLSSRKEGVYIVNVISDKNEIYSEKIIKK